MKSLLLLVIMIAMSLPTLALSGNICPDLEPENINERVRANQRMNDRLVAQQGRKAYAQSQKKHAAEQAKVNNAMKNMQKIKMPQASMPDLSR